MNTEPDERESSELIMDSLISDLVEKTFRVLKQPDVDQEQKNELAQQIAETLKPYEESVAIDALTSLRLSEPGQRLESPRMMLLFLQMQANAIKREVLPHKDMSELDQEDVEQAVTKLKALLTVERQTFNQVSDAIDTLVSETIDSDQNNDEPVAEGDDMTFGEVKEVLQENLPFLGITLGTSPSEINYGLLAEIQRDLDQDPDLLENGL